MFIEKYLSSSAMRHNAPDAPGGAPSPAASSTSAPADQAPATPASEAPAGEPSSTSDAPFDGFGNDDDDLDSIDLGATTESSQEPAPQGQPVQPTPPAPAPAAPVEEAKPAATTEAPAPKETSSSPSELDSIVQSMDTNAPALQEWLAQNAFALTKEEVEAFELDAAGTVPKLMARVAVQNMKSTMNLVKNLVPKLIQEQVEKLTSSKEKANEAISEFYTANPHLNKKDHGALVDQWAKAFRAANPKASRKEAIDYVGKAVSIQAGVMPGAPPAQPRAQAFAPARPGARQPVVTNKESDNPFAGLGGNFDEE